MDENSLHPLAVLHPPGTKVRIVKDSQGNGYAELFDSYTVLGVRNEETLSLRDNLGNKFRWPARDCIHPGLDIEWILRNSPAFAKDSPARRLLRSFAGKRFLRLSPSVCDRILLQQPDLKQRILDLLASLNP